MHIQDNKIRRHVIKIRVNSNEMTAIKTKAGASATAEWLRNLAMNLRIDSYHPKTRYHARVHKKDPERSLPLYEIGRIGNNLNQLTRAINKAKYTSTTIDLVTVAIQLNLIWKELHVVQQNI